jgi:hypothetical protein
MAFDGSDFVVLDDAIVEVSGSGPLAVDVYAEQRLRGNAYYLTTGRCPTTLTLYHGDVSYADENTDYPMDRPWMSLDYASGVRVPIAVNRGMKTIRLSLLYRCECPYDKTTYNAPTAGGDMYYQIRLISQAGQVIGSTEGTLARTESPSLTQDEAVYAMAQLSLTIAPYSGPTGYGTLEFRIKSELGADSGSNATLTQQESFSLGASANGTFAYPASPPASTSPELLVVQDPGGDRYEIYSMRPNGSAPEDIYVYPFVFYKIDFNFGSVCDLYWLSYIQVRSIQIDVDYDSASIAPIDVTALGAHKAVRASEFLAHAVHPTSLYERPRAIAYGPPGYRPTRLEQWPAGYHTRWPIATDSAPVDFVDESVYLDVDNTGRIEIALDVIGSLFSPQYGSDGESAWDFVATLYTYDTPDANWSTPDTVATTTLTATVKTYRVARPTGIYYDTSASRFDYPRFLFSKYILHDSQSTPEDWQYPHREGLLYPEDTGLIQRIVLSIDLSSAATGMHRLTVSAAYDSDDFDETVTDRLHLTCVGFSANQFRNP